VRWTAAEDAGLALARFVPIHTTHVQHRIDLAPGSAGAAARSFRIDAAVGRRPA